MTAQNPPANDMESTRHRQNLENTHFRLSSIGLSCADRTFKAAA
jgi:hypothetical protein